MAVLAVLSRPFRRRHATAAPGVGAEDGSGVGAVERPRRPWEELDPLDRVVTSVLQRPVVASAPRFARELPSRWTAPAAIQPLGHDVRPDLAGGLVRGLTVAATTASARSSDAADLRW